MKYFLILVLVLVQFYQYQCDERLKGTIFLTDENFLDELKQHKKLMVFFYDPRCPFCKFVLPQIKEAIHLLKNYQEANELKFALLDVYTALKLAKQQKLEIVPDLRLYNYNTETGDYTEEHVDTYSTHEIVNFVLKHFGILSQNLQNPDQANEFFKLNKATCVFYGKQNSTEHQNYLQFIKNYKHYHVGFAEIFDSELIQLLELQQDNILLVQRQFDKEDLVYFDKNQEYSVENIRVFVDDKSRPIIEKVNHLQMRNLFHHRGLMMILIKKKNDQKSDRVHQIFENAAHKIRAKDEFIQFSIVFDHSGSQEEEKLCEILGVDQSSLPQIRLLHPYSMHDIRKYQFVLPAGQYLPRAQDIIQFYDDYMANKLELYHLNEDIDSHDHRNLIRKLNRESFNSTIFNTEKDVVVIFYTSWCDECHRAEAAMKSLANQAKNINNLIFTKIDISKNNIHEPKVREIPQVYLYRTNNKQNPVVYEDSHNKYSQISLLRFFRTYLTVNFEGSIFDNQNTQSNQNKKQQQYRHVEDL